MLFDKRLVERRPSLTIVFLASTRNLRRLTPKEVEAAFSICRRAGWFRCGKSEIFWKTIENSITSTLTSLQTCCRWRSESQTFTNSNVASYLSKRFDCNQFGKLPHDFKADFPAKIIKFSSIRLQKMLICFYFVTKALERLKACDNFCAKKDSKEAYRDYQRKTR